MPHSPAYQQGALFLPISAYAIIIPPVVVDDDDIVHCLRHRKSRQLHELLEGETGGRHQLGVEGRGVARIEISDVHGDARGIPLR